MNFAIDEEAQAIVELVREFRLKKLVPKEREFLLKGKMDPQERWQLQLEAKEQGLWALDVPKEYGGLGLNHLTMCLIYEEMYKSPQMFRFGGSPEPALYLANDDQKERYLLPVIRGEKRMAYAFTEPQSGSDLQGIRTTAKYENGSWVLNGRKIFISRADIADFLLVFAANDLTKGARGGISCFIVDKDTPGFKLQRPIPTMGDDWEPWEIVFEDCRVPEENVLGEIGQAFAVGDYQLTHGRLLIAAYNLGIAQRCLDEAVQWAKQRRAFGKPIAERQAIQWMLADSEVELQAARLLTYKAAWMQDTGQSIRNEAFIAKLYASEMAQRVTDRALQIFGGMGYAREVPIQSFYRQARLWRIGHGTSEIHRWMIARNLLRD